MLCRMEDESSFPEADSSKNPGYVPQEHQDYDAFSPKAIWISFFLT